MCGITTDSGRGVGDVVVAFLGVGAGFRIDPPFFSGAASLGIGMGSRAAPSFVGVDFGGGGVAGEAVTSPP